MALIRLVYASAATKPFDQSELRELLQKARTNNSALGITGMLLYHKGSFFQILEGPEEEVAPLFTRIEGDPRHDRVLLLSKTEEKEPSFGAWSMGFIDVDQAVYKLPGFVKLLEAKSSFLDLQGDAKVLGKLIDGFQEGRWRQGLEA